MKKPLVEFLGTFFLVLTIGLTVLGGVKLAPIAIGVALMVMIYAGGHLSGAHYNPAVTLAVLLRGRIPVADVVPYMIAQVAGAAAAAGVVLTIHGEATAMSVAPVPGLLAEFLFTFALAYVVLNVATARGTEHNSFYGFAIGGTVLVGALAVGGISGGAFNPAVVVGLVVLGVLDVGSIWIHLVGQIAGGIAAALAFNYLNGRD